MKTILAIDLGKRNSVFCKLDTSSLKIEYSTVKTVPDRFHDIFADLDSENSIVLFEVGNQAGWLSDMLRAMQFEFKIANVNLWRIMSSPGLKLSLSVSIPVFV